MNSRAALTIESILLVVGVLLLTGCAPVASSTTASESAATIDEVRTIVAELMNVEQSDLTSDTSLEELDADDLDVVELVMELEDHFGISISDETAEGLVANMSNVTLAKLAAIVDERKGASAE
jgi:acyl carrier protein